MGSSQRHKCVEHDYTVLADGTSPAHSVVTYPDNVNGSAIIALANAFTAESRRMTGNSDTPAGT